MWPVAGLRVRTRGVALRPVGEADLDELGLLLPDDVGLDPRIPQPFGLPLREARAVALRQEYLRDLAVWTPADWTLPCLVETPDGVVGVQTLEGRCADGELTIETASWLVAEQRGRGIGTAMRHAVLGFGFDSLGAVAAVSEAWATNLGSRGVSNTLGYEETGTAHAVRGDGEGDMVSMCLTAAAWRSRPRVPVEVEGWAAACRPFFTPPR
jgi:RimJ/RimL family protein N-acetyltransferase